MYVLLLKKQLKKTHSNGKDLHIPENEEKCLQVKRALSMLNNSHIKDKYLNNDFYYYKRPH